MSKKNCLQNVLNYVFSIFNLHSFWAIERKLFMHNNYILTKCFCEKSETPLLEGLRSQRLPHGSGVLTRVLRQLYIAVILELEGLKWRTWAFLRGFRGQWKQWNQFKLEIKCLNDFSFTTELYGHHISLQSHQLN